MDKKEITYPVRWEYRIFVESTAFEETRQKIGGILSEHDRNAIVADGGKSSSGKYLALRAGAEVNSKEEAEKLAAALSAVDGVKFIL